ncbi:MAG: helix-turn-helix domain-containing protein [Tatlockia sp.]|nr:helix-turn-helix domain-containing protein [Tatlockia sp.]
MESIELERPNKAVCQVLRKLMVEANIKEADLARKVNLPQTTVNRLLLGGTSDPRANTLKPIADFFAITIGQLCGFEPLPDDRIPGTTSATQLNAWRFIPIIDWDQVSSWMFTKKNITPINHKHWIGTERAVSNHSFGLQSLSFMEPRFRKTSILIVDPDADYKDGHYIVVALDGIHPTVRKILKDGSDTLLQSFDQQQSSIKFTHKHTIYGTIVESRMDTYT